MKKFTFLLGSLLVGLSASAQLYVTGGNVEGAPAAWNPGSPLEVELTDGGYTFQATGAFKISTEKGANADDWTSFNGGAKMLDGTWAKTAGGNTASANLKAGDVNISAPNPGNDDVKITYKVNADLSSISATLPNGLTYPSEIVYPDLYLVGSFNSWTLKDATCKMDLTDNVYTITLENGLEGEWKINNGTWGFSLGQGEAGMPEVGTEYSLGFDGGNLSTSITEKVTVKLTYNEGGPYTLLLTTDGQGGGGGGEDPEPNFSGWYFNFGTASFMDENNEGFFRGKAIPEDGIVEYGEVELGTAAFQIKIWDKVSDKFYVATPNEIPANEGVVLSQVTWGEMTVAGATENSVYDVKWDMNTCTLTMTKVGGDEPPIPGEFEGWYVNLGWAGNPSYWKGAAVPETGIVEIEELKIGTDGFKVKIWDTEADAYYTSSTGTITAGEATVLVEGVENDEMTIEDAVAGDVYNAKYDCNTNTLTLTFVRNAGGDVEEPIELYLTGSAFGGWDANEIKMTRDENVYTYVAEEGVVGEWKVTDGTWDFSLGSNGNEVVADEAYVLGGGANPGNLSTNFTGKTTITITKDENVYTMVITTEGGDVPPTPEVPETLYLMGNINATGWAPNNGLEMTRTGNVYTCESIITDAGAGVGYFSFATQISEESGDTAWGDVNGANRFGPAAADTEATPGSALPFTTYVVNVNASSCPSWKIAASAEYKAYKFVMDFDANTLTVTEITGVEMIDADVNGTAVYFNLQGQRVENPANGIFVRVLNGKAEKIMK